MLVVIASHWFALAAVASAREVTLDEALRAAEAVPEVVAARAIERAAAAHTREARAPGEPSLTLETRSVSARASVGLSVPFRWAGQRSAAVTAARADEDAALLDRAAAVGAARRAARAAWFTLAASEERLRAASDALSRAEKNRDAIGALVEVQRAARLDAVRVSTEVATATAAVARAEHEVIVASAELRALLGANDARLTAGTAQPTPPPEGTLDSWLERTLESSPELAAAEAELRAAEARVKQRSREKLPALSLETGADWNDPTQPGTDAWIGMGFTFPTRGSATLDVARAERDRASALVELARRRAEAEVEAAWSATRAARARFEAMDGKARPAAVEAAEMTRIGYGEGRFDLFRLLDAERALTEVERDRADAYQEWGVAYADLERLAPEPAP